MILMVQKVYCDQCGQEIDTSSRANPVISLSILSPPPTITPNLCSYDCAIAWLQARQSVDANIASITLTIPANGAAPAIPSTPIPGYVHKIRDIYE